MRTLGVDPGLTRCGLGVVDGPRPGRAASGRGGLSLVAVGVVRTPAGSDPGERLLFLSDEVERWLDRFEPDAVAIERVYAGQNTPNVMSTAQASGVVMLAAARRGLPVVLHTPTEVKAAVTGTGRADKAQVAAMVVRILGLKTAPRPADAADALAVAICRQWRGAGSDRLAVAAASERARIAAVAR